MDWLWGLAETLEEKKYLLSTLITKRSFTSFWSESDIYRDTAIKIAKRDKQDSKELLAYISSKPDTLSPTDKLNVVKP